MSVATTVAGALACPVAIAIPVLGSPVVVPSGSLDDATTALLDSHARAVIGAAAEPPPQPPAFESVPVRIADEVVGIVAAAAGSPLAPAERRAWLEAAASAASVTALILDAQNTGPAPSDVADLLAELVAGEPGDLHDFLVRARRAGTELGDGAIALSARRLAGDGRPPANGELRAAPTALVGQRGPGRLLALIPLGAEGRTEAARAIARQLRDDGWTVGVSAARSDPTQLHQAVVEAELLTDLRGSDPAPAGQDETYRLLIGVLLRDPGELLALRQDTISPLTEYDARHDTDLLATLRAFLTHDGSTTETAEVMQLHRHTVGYRLTRVHEVSGLSPYESDGRERLSLGLKAQQILEAAERRRNPY